MVIIYTRILVEFSLRTTPLPALHHHYVAASSFWGVFRPDFVVCSSEKSSTSFCKLRVRSYRYFVSRRDFYIHHPALLVPYPRVYLLEYAVTWVRLQTHTHTKEESLSVASLKKCSFFSYT